DADEAALGGFGRLADRFRHLARLAVAEADAALLVADDDQRGEAETPAALHDLGDAVDVNELVDKLAVALFPIPLAAAAVFALSCHFSYRSSDIVVCWRRFKPRISVRPRARHRRAP